MGTILRTNYEPPKLTRCPDCGEDLIKPHPLGAHIPGCSLDVDEFIAKKRRVRTST